MEEKRFSKWISLKEDLHKMEKLPKITEGDIWWCSIGENVGTEINGKSELFSRPVIILKKFSRYEFIGIPLTSKKHDGSWYAYFRFKNRNEWASLTQARSLSVSRLHNRMGQLADSDYKAICDKFLELLAF